MKTEEIAKILKDNITFSGQVGDYVIHGAIEKIQSLHQSRIEELQKEIDRLRSELGEALQLKEYQSYNIQKLVESLNLLSEYHKAGFDVKQEIIKILNPSGNETIQSKVERLEKEVETLRRYSQYKPGDENYGG